MPKFSQESFSKLSTCHPDLQCLFYEVIKNFDCMILEGYRNQQEQDLAYSEGRSKLQWPNGKHNHQPSMAVDVTPYPVNFTDLKRLYWFAGYVMGIAQKLKDEGKITHAIRFGGDWSGDVENISEHFTDLQHFEIIE